MNLSIIPYMLIWFRAIAGFIIIGVCLVLPPSAGLISSLFLALGVLSDIFDGIIARKLNSVTTHLRLWDSRIDVLFWLCVAIGVHILHPNLWHTTWIMVLILGSMEMLTRIISQVRFKKEASTHHILSKIFTLFLWVLLTQLFITGAITPLFWISLIIGMMSQIEAMLIMSIIPYWACDIKNIFAALKMREK